MKVVFISNFLNHHQLPVAEELFKELGENYTFVSTAETPESFLNAGYPDCRAKEYNLLAYRSEKQRVHARRIISEADFVIFGAASFDWIRERRTLGKPIIIYSERWFKDFTRHLFSPGLWRNILFEHLPWRSAKNIWVLCASAFLPNDLDWFGLYRGHRYKWGYFTECPKLDFSKILEKRNPDVVDIFWCARFIFFKKWEMPIKMAYRLKSEGFKFRLRMAGSGPYWEAAKKLIQDLSVEDCVSLIGNFPNKKILEMMRESNIFLFTSNREEGWGAVLSEAMGAGMAVVAGNKIGSAPYLIKDGENGMLFKSCNLDDLTEKTRALLKNSALRERISTAAYETMQTVWSPETAAIRLLEFCKSIKDGNEPSMLFENGPCSLADKK